jgi:hypothetical protein
MRPQRDFLLFTTHGALFASISGVGRDLAGISQALTHPLLPMTGRSGESHEGTPVSQVLHSFGDWPTSEVAGGDTVTAQSLVDNSLHPGTAVSLKWQHHIGAPEVTAEGTAKWAASCPGIPFNEA